MSLSIDEINKLESVNEVTVKQYNSLVKQYNSLFAYTRKLEAKLHEYESGNTGKVSIKV